MRYPNQNVAGALARGPRYNVLLPQPTHLDHLRVVLVSTRNPLNIGAAARALSNFGCPHLRLVQPFEASFREARSAVGAADILRSAREFPTVADAVADCTLVIGTTAGRNRQLQQPLRPLPDAARLIRSRLSSQPVALLFGSEKRGLSTDDLAYCHWLLRIPTREAHPSMNLGQAVAVCLYELSRVAAPAKATRVESRPSIEQLLRMEGLLFDSLDASGYVKPRAGAAAREKIRLLLRRAQLTAADAETWTGMLRKISGQLQRDKDCP